MGDPYPTVPEDDLAAGGWTLVDRTEETLFRTPTAAVEGHTLLYEDARLRAALAEAGVGRSPAGDDADGEGTGEADEGGATDGDGSGVSLAGRTGDGTGPWRFLFATALSFRPPLAPGIGPATVRPTVLAEARNSFARDLRSRGFEAVDRGRSERMRTRAGDRARLTKFTARLDAARLDRDGAGETATDPLRIEAWLAVWSTGGSFRIAGGAYPVSGLDSLLAGLPADERPPTDPRAYRSELLDLVRAVE